MRMMGLPMAGALALRIILVGASVIPLDPSTTVFGDPVGNTLTPLGGR